MKEKKEMTVEQLLNGKELIVAGKKYLPTKEYVEPFLDKMSKYTDTFLVKARTPNIITSDIENIGYSRVLVQAVLNDKIDNHQNVIGLLYGLDTRVPIAKIYSGAINCACTNLCVFNPSEITVQEMTHQRINYSMVDEYVNNSDNTLDMIKGMKEYIISISNKETRERLLGKWMLNSMESSYDNGLAVSKISSSMIMKAYKSLFLNNRTNNKYFAGNCSETTMFNVYNAFTEIISHDDRDFFNMPDKTLLLRSILEY